MLDSMLYSLLSSQTVRYKCKSYRAYPGSPATRTSLTFGCRSGHIVYSQAHGPQYACLPSPKLNDHSHNCCGLRVSTNGIARLLVPSLEQVGWPCAHPLGLLPDTWRLTHSRSHKTHTRCVKLDTTAWTWDGAAAQPRTSCDEEQK